MLIRNVILLLVMTGVGFYSCGPQKPKNVIVMISDGCGYNHIDATSLYEYGQTGKQIYEQFPVIYGMSSFSLNYPLYEPDSIWASFDHVRKKPTDSGASATAMATGVKTLNGMIGMDSSGVDLENILERLEKYGKSSGIVSSVPISHATPAGFSVHNESRGNYEEIARSMIKDSQMEVIMGCGHPYFDGNGKAATDTNYRYVGGPETWRRLLTDSLGNDSDGDGKEDAWTLISNKSEFKNMITGDTPKRVFGLAQVGAALQVGRSGERKADPFVVPLNGNVPTLADMTKAALNVLDNNHRGFTVMIEGGAVDWASHGNQSGRMIEEEMDFNRAVEAVINWVEKYSSWDETLLIVTADHETGYLTGPGSNDSTLTESATINEIWKPLVNNGKGKLPGMQWNSGGHTNSLVPLYAKGAGSEYFEQYEVGVDPVRGKYVDVTSIAKVIFEFYPEK